MRYLKVLAVVAVFFAAWAQGEHALDEDAYLKVFEPYRDVLEQSFNNLFIDRDPPRFGVYADYLTCDVCRLAYPLVKNLVALGTPTETIINTIINLCVSLGIESRELCDPTIRAYAEPVLHIVVERKNYTTADLCGIINRDCGVPHDYLTNWEIQVDENKPPVALPPPLPENIEIAKILHLTDIHVDVNYTVGTDAGCGKPLCCREGEPEFENTTAGLFGHFSCALPVPAFEEILSHARQTHEEIKYIFLTGDYVHSGVWLYSQEENGRNIRAVTDALVEAFPNTAIYPLVGNHEPDVVNMYPPEELWDEFDLSWLYELVSSPFRQWLGEEQLATFRKGGYYTVRPEPGLRIVALNTNLCYLNNFWLAYDPVDPTGQLQWFADTMLEAEQAGDNVFIIGHISPGSGACWTIWSEKFDRIVNRFENLIRGQFYGHSHTEKFVLSFENGTTRPTTVSYVGPSAVTDGMNSGYRIYSVDGARGDESTWEVVDYETWILNITESNEQGLPIWEKLFSAIDSYGLESVRPADLYDFVLKMLFDDDLFAQFQWQRPIQGDNPLLFSNPLSFRNSRHHNKGLSNRGYCERNETQGFGDCKLGLLCDTVIANSADDSPCERLVELWNSTMTTELPLE